MKPGAGARKAAGGPARLDGTVGDAPARRIGQALSGLKPEARAITRGTRDAQVYQAAAASVVLVVSKDGLGSGVVVGPGRIVTNYHVVEGGELVGVIFKPAVEGAEIAETDARRGKVVKTDQVADLALIEVAEPPAAAKPLELGALADLQIGADVHAIGHPDGESWTYTRGIVSQIRRDYAWTTESNLKHTASVIQTQTPINPGNSGGPLISDDLKVVGINSFGSDGEGLNFAVSADDVKAFLDRAGDRKAEAARPDPEDCEPVSLEEWEEKDPPGLATLVDLDCDGEGDGIHIEPKDKKEGIQILLDADGDGNVDTIYYDENRDGQPDLALYDTDGDEKADLAGYFKDGEWEPYRWEKISPGTAKR